MRKQHLSITVFICLAIISCQQNQASKEQSKEQAPAEVTAAPDEIVKASVTGKDGTKMDMSFNNTKATVTVLFNGEMIDMKRDTMASGIKYSNDHYELTEWHGQGELKKDGKTVFSYKN